MTLNKPTQYSQINLLLTEMSLRLVRIFNNKLIGIYLFGSLSYGDFDDRSSDIDLAVVLQNSVSEQEAVKLELMHKQLEQKFPEWSNRIEMSYIPQQMLSSILPPGARPYFGEGVFYPKADYGNEWIINLYLLQNHGISIFGPAFKDLIPSIKIKDVQKACVRDLFKEWEPKLREPEWLDNPHYQSYLVLNLCRILNTITNATTLSKKKSARWVIQEYPEWQELIQTAQDWYYGKKMRQKEKVLEFLKFVIKEVNIVSLHKS